MLKLFAVLLGGRADGCHIELHDVVFAIGETIKDTHAQLVQRWFGNKKRLHIDSYIELSHIDGYQVSISNEKPTGEHANKKIFFVNFGAYKENYFGEIHERGFYVAEKKPDVLARAKSELCLTLIDPHCDDNLDIDDIISFNKVNEYYIHLQPQPIINSLMIKSHYQRLDLVAS